ncbi:52 kDa repressor of the inhibitor of the protein kinaselike, partial [Caligus rogercresseyi]
EDDCQALPPSKRRRKTTKCADASYHNFPKDPNLLVKWIKACQKDKYFNPKTSRLCSTHFKDSCYERDLRNELLGLKPRRLLKTGSVPTINLNEGSSGDEGTEGS